MDHELASANALAEAHLPLVGIIAHLMRKRLPRSRIEFDELLAAGNIGLVEASRRFSPERGIRFRTFAAFRIRGAILDYLRRTDNLIHTPRQAVGRDRLPNLEHESLDHIHLLSIADGDQLPDQAAVLARAKQEIRDAVEALPERHRRIVLRYYFEDGTLVSLTEALGVRHARLSGLHVEALALLREEFQQRGITPASLEN